MKKLIFALLAFYSITAQAQTVPNASPLYNSYACNSSTTQFPYSFYINTTSDIVVQQTDNNGNITFPTNFSIDTTNVWVNYPLTGSPCPTGYTLTLYASTPITQITTYGNRTPFTATAVGSSLNKLTIIDQQLQRQLNSALLLPVGQTPGTFPSSSPGNYIGWNGSGVLSNIPSPANAALWSLSGANAVYNLGNVSTTGNLTASLGGSSFASNVGIGSSNPGQSLDVQGTVRATGFMTSSGTSSQFLKANGSVDSTVYISSLSPITLSGSNVGIGSANPGQVLDVQGTIRAKSFSGMYIQFSNYSTPSRSIGSVYQNTTGYPMQVQVAAGGSVTIYGNIGATSSPSTVVSSSTGSSGAYQGAVSFMVPNNYYYEVTQQNGSASLTSWVEMY